MSDPLEQYEILRTIGEGSFGKVKLAKHKATGYNVAIKILDMAKMKAQEMEKKIQREICILRLFDHPHVIKLYDVIETKSHMYVVMEYAKNGVLLDYILRRGKLGEAETRYFFQQTVSALEYCHAHQVVHRDLKPENVLICHGTQIKIADFGLSNVFRDGKLLETSCGSPNYAAPEVLSGEGYSGPEVDVWSCGVMLYGLLCGCLPFDEPTIPELFRVIESGKYKKPKNLSPEVMDLISRMLTVNPAERITIAEIRKHPWFCVDLPVYLSEPFENHEQAITIDETILTEAANKSGISTEEIGTAIRAGQRNQITVAYHLIADNSRRRLDMTASHDTRNETTVTPAQTAIKPRADLVEVRKQRFINSGQFWQIGIQTYLTLGDLMCETCRVLLDMNFVWFFMDQTSICAKPKAQDHPEVDPNQAIKKSELVIRIHVHRIGEPSERKIVLDIERASGSVILFLDTVMNLISRLNA